MAIRQDGGMSKLIEVLLWLFLSIAVVADHIGAISLARQHGADTACATTKECPPDFEAKWVEAGCLCVPSSKARR